MTVQTTFAASGNPWATFMDMKPMQFMKMRGHIVKPKKEREKRPVKMGYELRIGCNENPTGGDVIYTNWGEIIGKIDKTNYIVCEKKFTPIIGASIRKWCARRKMKVSVTTDKNFGNVYLRWL